MGFQAQEPQQEEEGQAQEGEVPGQVQEASFLVSIPFLEPGQSPHHVTLGRPVCITITTTLITQAEEMVDEMKGLHLKWDHLAQEADKAEKERERMSNWVSYLLT